VWQHRLLPGELREDAHGLRSPRDRIVDVVACLVALGISALVLVDTWEQHPPVVIPLEVVLGVASFAALAWRRSHPERVGAFTAAAAIVAATPAGAAVVGAFNVALRGSRRAILLVVALSTAGTLAFPWLYPPADGYLVNVLVGALVTSVVIGCGLLARVRREQMLFLRDRAVRVAAEQRLRVEQAREAERRRIAREMHDVLAHRISLLSLHAGALEFRPDAPPEEVAEAAGVIRATARSALEELREVIGVLRDGADGAPPEPPQPTLAQVPALVEEARAAGARVSCTTDLPRVGDVLGRTVYRVVQEGLTNARKHAPGAAVDVRIGGEDPIVVEVVSRRPVGVAAARAADPALPGAGSGLIGLGERVALAGGTLEHGPDRAGDFVLRATLPRVP
jgi:signal transduction histidine kinase